LNDHTSAVPWPEWDVHTDQGALSQQPSNGPQNRVVTNRRLPR
jgi:hypothetical protein